LFSDGVINWGRIVVVLCFGYRVIIAALRRGLGVVFSQLVQFVVQFFVNENIVRWVAAHGGWVSSYTCAASTYHSLPAYLWTLLHGRRKNGRHTAYMSEGGVLISLS